MYTAAVSYPVSFPALPSASCDGAVESPKQSRPLATTLVPRRQESPCGTAWGVTVSAGILQVCKDSFHSSSIRSNKAALQAPFPQLKLSACDTVICNKNICNEEYNIYNKKFSLGFLSGTELLKLLEFPK